MPEIWLTVHTMLIMPPRHSWPLSNATIFLAPGLVPRPARRAAPTAHPGQATIAVQTADLSARG